MPAGSTWPKRTWMTVVKALMRAVGRRSRTVDAAFSRLAALAAAGNPEAIAILTDAARSLARAIVVIVNLLDIDGSSSAGRSGRASLR